MVWVRLDDQFYQHPKVLQAGPLAGWLHVCALCYCNQYLTDGFVPSEAIGQLARFDGIGVEDWTACGGLPPTGSAAGRHDVEPGELPDRLVAAGLWERVEGGYQIHDFLDYNLSKAEVIAERDAAKARSQSVTGAWRAAVLARDNYTCQACGAHGVSLEAHHIRPWFLAPSALFDISNGITLCAACHRLRHAQGWVAAARLSEEP